MNTSLLGRCLMMLTMLVILGDIYAGEEIMPLAPGTQQWNQDSVNSPYIRRVSSKDGAQPPRPQGLRRNTVKLTLPAQPAQKAGQPKLRIIEARQNQDDGSLDFDLTSAPVAYFLPEDDIAPAGRTIIPSEGPVGSAILPAFGSVPSLQPLEFGQTAAPVVVKPEAISAMKPPAISIAALSPASTQKRTVSPYEIVPIPELLPQPVSLSQASWSSTSPATVYGLFGEEHFEIPGLFTPETIAMDMVRDPAYADMQRTPYSQPKMQFSVLHDLPPMPDEFTAMPIYGDPAIDTLEPFAPKQTQVKARPVQVELPPPIIAIPAPTAGLLEQPVHPSSPSAMPVPGGMRPIPVDTLVADSSNSLRPPPSTPAPRSGSVKPLLPMPPTGGMSLLHVPDGLSITGASSGSTAPRLLLPPEPTPRSRHSQAEYSAPAPRAAPRRAPAIHERVMPTTSEADEDGFTPMRNMRNLLGR